LAGVAARRVPSIGVAVGSILGRMGPTIILTLILLLGLVIAVDKVERTTLLSEAEMASSQTYFYSNDDLELDNRVRFPDGAILTYEEAFSTRPEMNEPWVGDQPPYEA